jgi:hypothetical protein
MDIERDVELDYVFQSLTSQPDRVGTIPLVGIETDIRMQAAETPGEYRIALWSRGEEPFQKTDAQTMNPLQFAALYGPLIKKNRSVLEMRGRRLAEEAEKFLKELSASE